MTTKTEIRAKFRRLRDSFVSSSLTEDLKLQLASNLKSLIQKDDLWCGYISLHSEADPIEATKSGRWAFPRVEGEELGFYLPQGEKSWLKSAWGILEPDPKQSQKIKIEQASGVLVPGVAFDEHGGRVGSGKGFYDRALKNYRGKKVGVAYSVQIADEALPIEPFDITMDYLVTERNVIAVKKG